MHAHIHANVHTHTELVSIELLVYQKAIMSFEKKDKPTNEKRQVVLGCESVLQIWNLEDSLTYRA